MLPQASVEARPHCSPAGDAQRTAQHPDPSLLRDEIEIARPLLEGCLSLSDADLVDCIGRATPDHWRLAASRRGLSELVSELVGANGDVPTIEILLRNDSAKISAPAVEVIVTYTREHPLLALLLLRRNELRPSHTYVMFWWCGPDERKVILQRFAVTREVLQDALTAVFPIAAAENWQDPLARKGLQFIEPRQRNRAALERSAFKSLDQAVAAAASGLTRELAQEISYLSGLKPKTGAKIFSDPGGEGIAVLCKAAGLQLMILATLPRGWSGS